MTAQTIPAAPECVPWCWRNHDGEGGWDDVQHAASGLYVNKRCERVWGRAGMADGATITIERFVSFADDEGVKIAPVAFRIEAEDDCISAAEALAFAALLREAVAFTG